MVAANPPAPPSGRSSRATQVITAWARPIRSTASATRSGSPASSGRGRRVSTWQNPQARVQPGAVDHEGGGSVRPALVDVRAARLLAHRDQIEVAEVVLEAEVAVAHVGLDPQPRRLALGQRHPARGSTPDRRSRRSSARSAVRWLPAGRRRPGPPRRWAEAGRRGRSRPRRSIGPGAVRHPLDVGASGPQTDWAEAIRASTTSDIGTGHPSAASEVTALSAIPQGTMWSNMARSVSTLRAKPWVVRPLEVRTPMAQIFLGRRPRPAGRAVPRPVVEPDPDPRVAGQPPDGGRPGCPGRRGRR